MANLLREKYAYSFKKFTAQLYKNTVAYSFHFNATILPITLFYTFSTVLYSNTSQCSMKLYKQIKNRVQLY